MSEGSVNEYAFAATANIWTSSIEVPGNIVGVLTATGDIEIDLGASKFTKARQSLTADTKEYQRVRVKSTTTQTIRLLLGFGSVKLPDDLTGVQVDVATADTLNQPGDVTLTSGVATEIAAANGTQRELLIMSAVANTVNIRVGTTGVGVASGVPITPGEKAVLTTSDDVFGFCSAAGQIIHVVSMRLTP